MSTREKSSELFTFIMCVYVRVACAWACPCACIRVYVRARARVCVLACHYDVLVKYSKPPWENNVVFNSLKFMRERNKVAFGCNSRSSQNNYRTSTILTFQAIISTNESGWYFALRYHGSTTSKLFCALRQQQYILCIKKVCEISQTPP